MQVGNSRKLLGSQTTIEGVEPPDAFVFALQVGTHKTNIGRQILEERTERRTTEYRDANVRMLFSQRIHHRHDHSHVA